MAIKHIKLWKAADGWRWSAIAGNNRVVGASEQGHKRKWYAKRKARAQFGKDVTFYEPVN